VCDRTLPSGQDAVTVSCEETVFIRMQNFQQSLLRLLLFVVATAVVQCVRAQVFDVPVRITKRSSQKRSVEYILVTEGEHVSGCRHVTRTYFCEKNAELSWLVC